VVGTTLTCAVHSDRFSHPGMPRNFIRNVAWCPVCSKISALLTCTVNSPPWTCSATRPRMGVGGPEQVTTRCPVCNTVRCASTLYLLFGLSCGESVACWHPITIKVGTGPSPSSDNDHHHPALPLSALCVAFLTPVQAKSTDHVINNY
jgi:hypothetical protein